MASLYHREPGTLKTFWDKDYVFGQEQLYLSLTIFARHAPQEMIYFVRECSMYHNKYYQDKEDLGEISLFSVSFHACYSCIVL